MKKIQYPVAITGLLGPLLNYLPPTLPVRHDSLSFVHFPIAQIAQQSLFSKSFGLLKLKVFSCSKVIISSTKESSKKSYSSSKHKAHIWQLKL